MREQSSQNIHVFSMDTVAERHGDGVYYQHSSGREAQHMKQKKQELPKAARRAVTCLLTAALVTGSLVGCRQASNLPMIDNGGGSGVSGGETPEADGTLVTPDTVPDVDTVGEVRRGTYDTSSVTASVKLTGDGATTEGSGVRISGSTVTFTAAGTYLVEGSLTDGQLIVDTTDAGKVKLILNGVSVTCLTGPAVFIRQAPKKAILYTAAESVNLLSDGSGYVVADEAQTGDDVYPNACVYACDDLKLDGEGVLQIIGNADKGINTKDDLEITGGTLVVNSSGTAVRGNDSIEMSGGTVSLTVTGEGDGLKSAQTEKEGKGWITVSGGDLYITAIGDGISAATDLTVSGGTLVITTLDAGGTALTEGDNNSQTGGFGGFGGRPGGMDGNSNKATISAKGLKAAETVTLTGGKLTITAADDGIHADDTVLLQGGEAYIRSGDDGVHADRILTLSGGRFEIAQSYEGLEAAQVTISGGTTRITSSDDGINASNGGGSGAGGGRPGGFGGGSRPGGRGNRNTGAQTSDGTEAGTLSPLLTVSGGYTVVYASGDGIDSNGNIVMTGGTLLVFGPTDNGNGAIDFGDGNCSMTISGGTLLAVGSSGMAETATNAGQAVFDGLFRSSIAAGTLVGLCDADGNLLCGFRLPKVISSIVFSSATLTAGEAYTLVQGGTAEADADGVLDLTTWTGYGAVGSRTAG